MTSFACPRCGEPQQLRSGLTQHQRGKLCLNAWLGAHGMASILEGSHSVWRSRQRVLWLIMSTELSDELQLRAVRALLTSGDEQARNLAAFQTLESVGRLDGQWVKQKRRLVAFLLGLVLGEEP